MGSRKRQKPNPEETAPKPEPESPQTSGKREENLGAPDQATAGDEVTDPDVGERAGNANTVGTRSRSTEDGQMLIRTQSRSKRPWYGGTWPRISKTAPVTQVARESIAAATSVATNLVASAPSALPSRSISLKLSPSKYLSRNRVAPGRSAPLAATTTKLNITSNTSELPTADSGPKDQASTAADGGSIDKGLQPAVTNDALIEKSVIGIRKNQDSKLKSSPDPIGDMNDKPASTEKLAETSSGWLSWFSSPLNPVSQQLGPEQSIPVNEHGGKGLVHSRQISLDPKVEELPPNQEGDSDPDALAKGSVSASQTRSWLGFWGSNSALPLEESRIEATAEASGETFQDEDKGKEVVSAPLQDSKLSSSISQTQARPLQVPRSTGWAFWSRENANSETSGSNDGVGKLAVADSPSQSQPEIVAVSEANGIPRKIGKIEKSKRQEIIEKKTNFRVSTNEDEEVRKVVATPSESRSKPLEPARKQAKNVPSNLILPSFRSTYREFHRPSLFQQVGRFIQYKKVPDTKRVGIRHDPPRIKKAVAIVSHDHSF